MASDLTSPSLEVPPLHYQRLFHDGSSADKWMENLYNRWANTPISDDPRIMKYFEDAMRFYKHNPLKNPYLTHFDEGTTSKSLRNCHLIVHI